MQLLGGLVCSTLVEEIGGGLRLKLFLPRTSTGLNGGSLMRQHGLLDVKVALANVSCLECRPA